MTLKELEKRIKRLTPGPLLLLCMMPDGVEQPMTVQEMIDTGSTFVKVEKGNNLSDLDRLIAYEWQSIRQLPD